jgi:hypothetical protein
LVILDDVSIITRSICPICLSLDGHAFLSIFESNFLPIFGEIKIFQLFGYHFTYDDERKTKFELSIATPHLFDKFQTNCLFFNQNWFDETVQ